MTTVCIQRLVYFVVIACTNEETKKKIPILCMVYVLALMYHNVNTSVFLQDFADQSFSFK